MKIQILRTKTTIIPLKKLLRWHADVRAGINIIPYHQRDCTQDVCGQLSQTKNFAHRVTRRTAIALVRAVAQIDVGSTLFLQGKFVGALHVLANNKVVRQKIRLSPISAGALIITVTADVA